MNQRFKAPGDRFTAESPFLRPHLDENPDWREPKAKGDSMKNKIFLLGVLIAMFAVSAPLIADPGGLVVASGLEGSYATTIPSLFAADIVPTVAVGVSLAIVPILFLVPAVRRRVLSIPWVASFWKNLKATAMKVRRQFDKLTVSPVLKRQSAA